VKGLPTGDFFCAPFSETLIYVASRSQLNFLSHGIRREKQSNRRKKAELLSQLQLLKSQVHPHFLFNTLNNLYALTIRNSPESPAVVLKLSSMLRYMLYECNVAAISLESEIEMLRNYISLEQIRYGDRLEVSVNITGDVKIN